MKTPLVLLDVDGVINDIYLVSDRIGDWGVDVLFSNGYQLLIPDYMSELIRDICSVAEVMWCTTWRHRANDEIASHLGIPSLDVVDDGTSERCVSWKPAAAHPVAAAALAQGRRVLWIEDFYGDLPVDEMPEGTEFLDTTSGCPGALLLRDGLPDWLRDRIEQARGDGSVRVLSREGS